MSAEPDLASVAALAGHWAADTTACTATFQVRDKLVTTVRGSFPVTGGSAVVRPDGDIGGSWVELDVAGVATGNARRDRDLHKPTFLHLDDHPVVRVEIERAALASHGWTGGGVVRARGEQAPVDLTVVLLERRADEVRAKVTGKLDRRPLGIRVPSLVIGRFLDLDVELTLRRVDRQ
ncbi:YceI family protein [Nocardioides piscis]|uniref:YceI family protein n=1 Tax=Nocardioides piscis TaxID=2714938 RepID=A0A6G7YDH2_9ACTN|nr:YceI family protein [Nocardioides piscis]QIK74843.1 YceI family protein [Nocardioides piscis]